MSKIILIALSMGEVFGFFLADESFIEKSTSTEMVFYAFISGTVLSSLVPVLVPLFIGL